jgi:hypothetical protein
LFALFQDQIVSKQHNSWPYIQTGEKVAKDDIINWFPNHKQIKDLNFFTGTAKFKNKSIYLLLSTYKWKYLNNQTVYFNGSQASEEEYPETSESENDSESDTTKVNKLLQSTERAITSAADKLASLPSTPQLQESLLPRISRPHSPAEQQVPTPPISKGKQPAPPPPPRAISSGPS